MNCCHKTFKPEARRRLLEMAQEDHNETSQQTAASDEEKGTINQASPPVIEIHDSTTECEDEARPGGGGGGGGGVQMEEKAFVSRLHSFMKDKGSPIERIPHLGFKQINLWRIYKAVEKRGGYDVVTAQRLWKKVYDELGGSPGSTSAATCTRRHYERLVLPFERHMKGEEDKPLPPSKPRKPYKRNSDGKVSKAEVKRKRSQSDREAEPEMLTQRSPEAACQTDAVMRPHSALWGPAPDRRHPDRPQPGRAPADLCAAMYAHHPLLVNAPGPWTGAHVPTATEVISPLEKKKRVAQASLSLPASPPGEDGERPSVIRRSQSPARASPGPTCNSSDGSPLPPSSSSASSCSSRSPSPVSVSSEDGRDGEGQPAPGPEASKDCPAKNGRPEDGRPAGCSRAARDLTGVNKVFVSHAGVPSLSADSAKSHMKDSAWKPIHKYFPPPFLSPAAFSVRSGCSAASASSFTKVVPKSVQLLRPAPIRPGYKGGRPEDALAKKLSGTGAPWLYQPEKREKSRTLLQKAGPAHQQGLSHHHHHHHHPATAASAATTTLPVSCVLSGYDKAGRDSRHQPPLHPVFLPGRVRLPQSQLMYRHIPVGPAHSAFLGSAVYPYPYPIPLLNPQAGYALPAMNPIYSHKL